MSYRAWAVWRLPRGLTAVIAAVVLADVAVVAGGLVTLHVRGHDLAVFGLLLACNAATVELARRDSESAGPIRDVHAVWELPVIVLLPLVYATLMPIARLALTQSRVRRIQPYRRVFSAAAIGIAYGCGSLTFRALARALPHAGAPAGRGVSAWLLAVALAAVVQWLVHQALMLAIRKAPEPDASLAFCSESLHNDITELCVAILATLAIAMSVFAAVIVLPIVTVLQRSFRHSQLVHDSRSDSKTGLLNAATWERESRAEVTRAIRTRTPLAVALLDIDRFKSINDTFGHLIGDEVIKGVANMCHSQLRSYDLAGRFGGEEFAVLLPQTRAANAVRIAERIRSGIAAISVLAPGAAGERVHVTVSVGVAPLEVGSTLELPELMAAADAALYRAKANGRDQVQMTSTAAAGGAPAGRATISGKVPSGHITTQARIPEPDHVMSRAVSLSGPDGSAPRFAAHDAPLPGSAADYRDADSVRAQVSAFLPKPAQPHVSPRIGVT